jgi:dolichyl-diphosphooligosaccharide--protein glycosyltransferase
MRSEEGGGPRLTHVFTPLALFVLAFAIRCLPIQSVFVRGRTLLFDPDAYYHLRRIVYTAVNFPSTLALDPYINHPDGGRPIWTPLFDGVVALLLLPWRGGDDPADLERAAVFVPPLLGAATVVTLYVVARRHFGQATATLAGVILALLSGHFWYSQLGFVDHHAAEALAATATLGAAMTLLARAGAAAPNATSLRRSALATGIGFAASFLLWPGMLLHVAAIEAALAVYALTRRERAPAAAFALQLALAHAIALALVAPFALPARWTAFGAFSPVVLSGFQPWLLGALSLAWAGCAAAWRRDAAGGSPARRLLFAAGLVVALGVASAWAFPGLVAAAGDPWHWFAGADSFQRSVGESLPLFRQGGEPTLKIAFARLSAFSLLVPLALGVGVRRALRSPAPAPQLACFAWACVLAAATIVQRRFFNAASVGVALLFALALVEAQRELARRFPRARIRVLAALALAAVALLLPTLQTYAWDAGNVWRALRGKDPRLTPSTQERVAIAELASWIRTATPIPSEWLDASARPAWGILAPWEIGHVLEYTARRPTVSDNFGNDIGSENYERALRYFQSDEASAAALLEALSVRYVVSQRDTDFLGAAPPADSMAIGLFERDGSAQAGAAALARHRLVHDAKPLYFTARPNEPRYKVFEFVRGAEIVGESAPGAQIRATLELRSNRGRPFRYAALAVAGDDGRYALRVPYATEGGPPGIEVAPAYLLACDGEQQAVTVDESAVQTGARIDGPDLCVRR